MNDKKISRKGFLALLASGIFGLIVSQLPGKQVFTQTGSNEYGNDTYGNAR